MYQLHQDSHQLPTVIHDGAADNTNSMELSGTHWHNYQPGTNMYNPATGIYQVLPPPNYQQHTYEYPYADDYESGGDPYDDDYESAGDPRSYHY